MMTSAHHEHDTRSIWLSGHRKANCQAVSGGDTRWGEKASEMTRTEGPPTQKARRKSSDFLGPAGEFAELQSARVGDEGLEPPTFSV